MSYDIKTTHDRRLIINEGSFPLEKEVTPNLEANEHMLVFLVAEGCPLKEKKSCVHLDYKVTSICKFLGFFSEMGESIPCNYEDSHTDRKLSFTVINPPCDKPL